MSDPGLYAFIMEEKTYARKMIKAATTFLKNMEKRFLVEKKGWLKKNLFGGRVKELEQFLKEEVTKFQSEIERVHTEKTSPTRYLHREDVTTIDTLKGEEDQEEPSSRVLFKPIKGDDYMDLNIAGEDKPQPWKPQMVRKMDRYPNESKIRDQLYHKLSTEVLSLSSGIDRERLKQEIQETFESNTPVARYYRRKALELCNATNSSAKLKWFFTDFHRKYRERYAYIKNNERTNNTFTQKYRQFKNRHKRTELKEKRRDTDIREQKRTEFNSNVAEYLDYLQQDFPATNKANRITLCGNMVQSLIQFEHKYLIAVINERVQTRIANIKDETTYTIPKALRSTPLSVWVSTALSTTGTGIAIKKFIHDIK